MGLWLVRALVERGYRVRALVRKRLPVGLLPKGVELFYANVDQPRTVAPALAGCDLIFHLAAVQAPGIPDAPMRQRMWRTNVDAVGSLVQMAQAQGVSRLLFFSTAQLYGATTGQPPATEETPLRPLTTFAQTKRAAEQLVLAACNQRQEPLAVALRLAPIWPVGADLAGGGCLSTVQPQSVVQAALLAATVRHAAGQIYNISDGCTHASPQSICTVGQLPYAPQHGARWSNFWAQLATCWSKPVSKARVNALSAQPMAAELLISSAKAQRQLGFRPHAAGISDQ